MKGNNQDLWLGVEHLNNDEGLKTVSNQEFVELPVIDALAEEKVMETKANRRDFLKYVGFSLGAATVAASCDIPVRRALPYVVKPDEIVPGVATYYASSLVKGGDYCSVLVKTREGRPIKIEGNTLSTITKGGTSARAQAAVLDLYDTSRVTGPFRIEGGEMQKPTKKNGIVAPTWKEVDTEIGSKLGSGNIRIVSNTIMSPTTIKAIEEFKAAFGGRVKHVMYDAISSSAILEANMADFGEKAIPDYHFDKADIIVSFEADFLGTWISPVEYSADYAKNRVIEDPKHPKMSRHVQVESYMSMTGSNADDRVVIKPSELGAAIANLYNEVAKLTSGSTINAPKVNDKATAKIKMVAKELVEHKGHSLVVAGSNNVGEQMLVNATNELLGNYGKTLDFVHASNQRKGIDSELQALVKEMNAGRVATVIFLDDCDPAFDLPGAMSGQFAAAVAKVGTKVTFATKMNDTAALCDYILPTHDVLESWGDVEAKAGVYSMIQPTIRPLFNTRQAEETLLTWAKSSNFNPDSEQPMFDYVKKNWAENIFVAGQPFNKFQLFWDSVLHDGVVVTAGNKVATASLEGEATTSEASTPSNGIDVTAAIRMINKPNAADQLEVRLFEDVKVGAGQFANNPWLQEMPEPVTRCTWGNYLQIPVQWDGDRRFVGFEGLNGAEVYGEADNVRVKANDVEGDCTAISTFGLKETTLAISLGYGRKVVGKGGDGIGTNVFPWATTDANGNFQYYNTAEYLGKVGEEKRLACVQYHHTIGLQSEDSDDGINLDEKAVTTVREGFQGSLTKRVVIRRTNLKDLDKFVYGQHGGGHGDGHGEGDHAEEGHHGSMNPFAEDYMGLVGERKHHQKLNEYSLYPGHEKILSQGHHWGMYVDLNACTGCGACVVACYAENNIPVVGKKEVGRHHEMAWLRIDRYYFGDYESPNVVYQPMMCQHCDNAPCENVCPVAATPHNSEGLNQMAYNRCIGTRYCANNCPYKVRRFNWLDYTTADLFPSNEPRVNGEEIPFGADNLTRMVLNPDVTVRSRGVIEKCSFCVQRIQAGKLTAKREGRRLRDADVRPACQTACPSGCITFGDRNDKDGELMKKYKSDMNYIALEQTNVRSSVQYGIKVVNKPHEPSLYSGGHGGDAHGDDSHSHEGSHDSHSEEAHTEEAH